MRIWVLEIGEQLPLEADARLHRYGEFTAVLAARGHDVTWWTSTFSHAQRRFVADADRDISVRGVTLRLIHGPGYARSVSLARVLHQRHFARAFAERADRFPRPDVIICAVPTLENADIAVHWGRAQGVPVVVDIRDLWPDELVDLAPAALRSVARAALRPLYRKMAAICEGAAVLTGVSESYLDYALRFAGRSRRESDFVFPLGHSGKRQPEGKLDEARRWLERSAIQPDRFTLCFFGTMGNFFALETVIEATAALRKEMPIQAVLAGTGVNRARFEKMARGVDEVVFPGFLTGPQIAAVMEVSKAGLAPYKSGAKMSLPNKPFEYFSGGLPVISSIQGELKRVLEEHDCGVTYRADSVEDLCAAIRSLYRGEARRALMGRNARGLLEQQFSSEAIFDRVAARLEALGGS